MKLTLVSLAVALALVPSSVEAWTITETNATKPEEVQVKHLDFIKTWIVTGSTPLKTVNFAAAGPVFVDYDSTLNGASPTAAPYTEAPSTETPTEAPVTDAPVTEAPTEPPVVEVTGSGSGGVAAVGVVSLAAQEDDDKVLAKITFSGNCTHLLDALEVTERKGVLKVHFKNQNFRGYGYLLTQVVVGEEGALSSISSSGSSSVYISEGVVASTVNSTQLTVSGDGDIFVSAPKTNFTLKSLDIKASGSGDVQFQAASLQLGNSLSAKISGEATLAVVADTVEVDNAIESKITGEGAVYIQAENVTTFKIDTKIGGEGAVTISKNGSCVSQDISISGEGKVETGSIACVDTKLKMSGEGTVLVQTSNRFLVPHEINGHVQYVGAAPKQITDGRKPRRPRQPKRPKHHGWFWWISDDDDSDDDDSDDSEDGLRYLPKSVTAAPVNQFTTYELKPVPGREPAFLVLTLRRNSWSNDPAENIVISIFGWDINVGNGSIVSSTQNFAASVQKQHGPLGAAALGVVAVAGVVAAGVAVHKLVLQRRRRSEYQPLLQVVTN